MNYRRIKTDDELIYINDINDELSIIIKLSSGPPEIGIDTIEGGDTVSQSEYELICGEVLEFLTSGQHPSHLFNTL